MSKKLSKKPISSPVELEKLKSEIAVLKEKLARSLADYDNLSKRQEAQKELFLAMTIASFMDKALSAMDDLHLVLSHLKDKGLEMAIKKMEDVLKSEGLEEIETKDRQFDPADMDCVDTDASVEKDKITLVKKKGYKFNGQIIRPAQVVVGTKTQ